MNGNIEQPIFIVGVGRSGTTLIQSMLNAHQNIAFTPETHFIRNYIGNKKIQKKDKDRNFDYIINEIKNDQSLKKLGFDYDNLINQSKEEKNFLINFYKKILSKYAAKKNKDYIGDKDPKNIEYLYDIKKYFPNAYIIHIIRDPRDVILSRMKAEWSKGRPFWLHALTYRVQIKKGRKDGKELFGNNYYELYYENLIEKPEEVLNNVCAFLKVEYDDEMLKFNQKADEIIKGEEKKWKDKCFEPVISNNKNKWINNMSKKEVLLTESIAKVAFEELNYKKSDYENKFSLINKLKYDFITFLSNLFDISYNIFHLLRWKQVKKY